MSDHANQDATEPGAVLADIAAAKGIRDARVLQAMRDVPRSGFVPPNHIDAAALDEPLPIGHDQVTTQPSLVAAMVEALELAGDGLVLEVGTGFGYQTALLARLARFVWSVEWWPDLASAARTNLAAAGIVNVQVVNGDGRQGPQTTPPSTASSSLPPSPRSPHRSSNSCARPAVSSSPSGPAATRRSSRSKSTAMTYVNSA
jgi:protein-L-isoaspartate(D-aspartate) O-methyltransferase